MSGEKMIAYDTLRKDGVYRLGARCLGNLSQPLEGKKAVDKLKEYFPSLSPLQDVGTRIIITKPKRELVHAFESGKFARYIQTTWWPVIEDPKVEIFLNRNGRLARVQIPEDLVLPNKDSDEAKVWIKEWTPLRPGRKELNIRRLHLCWSKRELAEDVKGVAVIRGGMVVERIPVSDLATLPQQISDHIYGCAEGDDGVQLLLKKSEDPTHYKFSRLGWGKSTFIQVKNYVSRELQLFAREKLGLESAERPRSFYQAVKKFNRILKNLGLNPFEIHIDHPIGPSGPLKPLDLVFSRPNFPRSYPRVNFGETVGIHITVVNRTEHSARVKLRVHSEQDKILREDNLEEDINIRPGKKLELPLLDVKIVKKKYTEGECKIIGLLNCLEHPNFENGADLDACTCKFWIQRDPPPGKGIFKDVESVSELKSIFEGHDVRLQYRVDPHPEGGCLLKVNTGHPAWSERCVTAEEADRYVTELMAQATPSVLTEQGYRPFDVDDPNEIMRRSSALSSLLLEKCYG